MHEGYVEFTSISNQTHRISQSMQIVFKVQVHWSDSECPRYFLRPDGKIMFHHPLCFWRRMIRFNCYRHLLSRGQILVVSPDRKESVQATVLRIVTAIIQEYILSEKDAAFSSAGRCVGLVSVWKVCTPKKIQVASEVAEIDQREEFKHVFPR